MDCLFFMLFLFSNVIRKRKGEKLISKTVKCQLYSSSKMQIGFFYAKDIQIFWGGTKGFYRKPGNDANNRGQGGQPCSLRHYDALHTKINM